MAIPVIMPALGMAQSTGRLVSWLKKEGERVIRGELLMEVETDKAVVEVEAQGDGYLGGILAEVGDDVPVGEVIAYLLAPGERPPDRAAEVGTPARPAPATAEVAASAPAAAQTPAFAAGLVSERPLASPKARGLARQMGIDLRSLTGSGPGGAVQAKDVEAAFTPAPEAPPPLDTTSALWLAMAQNMARSWREVPHFFLVRDVDATNLSRQRQGLDASVTLGDVILHRTAQVLAKHRLVNSSASEVNLGVAVASEGGLIVPVVRGAQRLGLAEFSSRRRELTERARAGRMRAGDLDGATFTVSNLGMLGVDSFSAIVTDGQAGILALGRVADRVVAGPAGPEVRPMLTVTLSCDHRRVDGARAAMFLRDLAEKLEAAG